MKTPYVRHIFGEKVEQKLRDQRGWLNAGVASSIPWPSHDVCIEYAGHEYFLRGTNRGEQQGPPCISIPCDKSDIDAAISKIYRFTSILGWFSGGYVDVAGYAWGSHPILYGRRTVYSSMGTSGPKSFHCNHMPIIETENVRKALAFWREGKMLDEVHDSYAFLSFYKVIESQFSNGKKKAKWIESNIDKLTGRAAARVNELKAVGVNVSRHLFESGRCAVAHATFEGEIVDPDIPKDRKRLTADLVIMEELARIYIRDELNIPDSQSLYQTRNRLEPWSNLLTSNEIIELKKGANIEAPLSFSGRTISVGIWPDGIVPGLENMTLQVQGVEKGVVKIALFNDRKTISLIFYLDYKHGRIHTSLEEGGIAYEGGNVTEGDIRAYWTFYYKVFSNGIAELTCDKCEPIDCEVVIPTNMMMRMSADDAIQYEILRFQNEKPRYRLTLDSGFEWYISTKKYDDRYQGFAEHKNNNDSLLTIFGAISKSEKESIVNTAEMISKKFNR
ncbi:hypothetical protein G8764_16800 [Pseudomaricurvus alcaniphilus]|uniref:methylamine utilization protein MauJ n=1 Tax=Pseudomaricurvus alcaniphilus TaxID=1166482 RepID=UPI0014074762|nr:methylamine utilization protein MauJ [Pseudomaricurvus alcaniphilus]NHN38970.1 hypothetical protein [Pseudomaricurvus alcaniphilus]